MSISKGKELDELRSRMNTSGTIAQNSQNYEEILLGILRDLPVSKIEQLVDFARFLKIQPSNGDSTETDTASEVESDNAEWDVLLSTDESQDLLNMLADEAIAEHKLGKTKPMVFTENGQIAPG